MPARTATTTTSQNSRRTLATLNSLTMGIRGAKRAAVSTPGDRPCSSYLGPCPERRSPPPTPRTREAGRGGRGKASRGLPRNRRPCEPARDDAHENQVRRFQASTEERYLDREQNTSAKKNHEGQKETDSELEREKAPPSATSPINATIAACQPASHSMARNTPPATRPSPNMGNTSPVKVASNPPSRSRSLTDEPAYVPQIESRSSLEPTISRSFRKSSMHRLEDCSAVGTPFRTISPSLENALIIASLFFRLLRPLKWMIVGFRVRRFSLLHGLSPPPPPWRSVYCIDLGQCIFIEVLML